MELLPEIKSRRICWSEPQAELSMAYMRELRLHHRTKKIYAVDPYVEVYQFRDDLYGLFSENADGKSDPWMFLIVGSEKAMLIDTSYGIGDLKGLVEFLAPGKEILVVNTHGHYDHAYGDCRFERVYCHKYEVPRLASQDGHIWDYLFDAAGKPIWLDFDRSDLPQWKPFEIVGCESGHVFHLGGGHDVELLWTGGHSPGHAMFLDKKNRLLFAGDGLVSMRTGVGGRLRSVKEQPYGEFASLQTFVENLRPIAARMDEYDFVFSQHFLVEVECDVIADELAAAEELLADPAGCDDIRVIPGPQGARRYRLNYIKGFGPLGYPEPEDERKEQAHE